MSYRVTKSYGHEQGLSACFRQWRAESHCSFVHGYALAFSITFEAERPDHRNWVVDFGAMGSLKSEIKELFDHKLLVAVDDPELPVLQQLGKLNIADVVVVDRVGCEAFARLVYGLANSWLTAYLQEEFIRHEGKSPYSTPRVRIIEVSCHEHAGNSASYVPQFALITQ